MSNRCGDEGEVYVKRKGDGTRLTAAGSTHAPCRGETCGNFALRVGAVVVYLRGEVPALAPLVRPQFQVHLHHLIRADTYRHNTTPREFVTHKNT
jgi:hypothetical protein